MLEPDGNSGFKYVQVNLSCSNTLQQFWNSVKGVSSFPSLLSVEINFIWIVIVWFSVSSFYVKCNENKKKTCKQKAFLIFSVLGLSSILALDGTSFGRNISY